MIFKSLNHVPKRLRKLRGTPLSKEQIDTILERADELSDGNSRQFPQSLADARKEFMEAHESVDSIWVARGAK